MTFFRCVFIEPFIVIAHEIICANIFRCIGFLRDYLRFNTSVLIFIIVHTIIELIMNIFTCYATFV